jgi:hypothetical protein
METPQEKTQRNDYVRTLALQRIKDGGVAHDVWVTRFVGLPDMQAPVGPVVEIANNHDEFYVQVFRNRSELDAFVAKLLAAADDAWPKGTQPA